VQCYELRIHGVASLNYNTLNNSLCKLYLRTNLCNYCCVWIMQKSTKCA